MPWGVGRRAAPSCRLARPGGVIVHAGLLPGAEGLDVRRLTLQEIIFTGTYCYTPEEFRTVVALLVGGRFGVLDWLETRPLADGAAAVADIDAGRAAAARSSCFHDMTRLPRQDQVADSCRHLVRCGTVAPGGPAPKIPGNLPLSAPVG